MKYIKILLLLLLIYIGYEYYQYHTVGEKYESSDFCLPIDKELIKFKGKTYCLDARKENRGEFKLNQKYSSLLLLAREKDKLREIPYTGHGWLVWFQFEQLDNETIKVYDFLPAGYGGDPKDIQWTKNQIDFYNKHIKKQIPDGKKPFVEKIIRSLNLAPVKYDESSPIIIEPSNPKEIQLSNIEKIFDSPNLGINPAILGTIIINENEYEKSKIYYDKYTKENYRLFFHDCTTLLLNMTSEFGLYRPPRIICPFPVQTIERIIKTNDGK